MPINNDFEALSENALPPTHLTCPFCPAQAFSTGKKFLRHFLIYTCPTHHTFYIADDPSFHFGHNEREKLNEE